jgi:hypothetical protein
MNKLLLFILCIFALLLVKQPIIAKTLHAILVADTIHDIRSITWPDLCTWQKELRVITQHTQMILKERVFCDTDFDKEKIKNYLKNLDIDEKDSIVFYFSGHGYRTSKKQTPWPFITFEFYKQGLDIQWITDIIRSKKPQFALVMTDCCNNFMEFGFFGRETKNILIKLRQLPPYYPGYHQLFCKAKGCIVISSCSEGEFSYGSTFGGLYTQCFFTSLNRELGEKKPSWKNLLQRANGYISHIQRPVCEVYR